MASRPTEEFRAEAVRVALTSGVPRKQVLIGQFNDAVGQMLLVSPPLRHLALRGSMLPKRTAGAALRHAQLLPHMVDALAATRRAQKFPFTASVRINLSSVKSDTVRRSRWFSFSSSFRRASCDRCIPP